MGEEDPRQNHTIGGSLTTPNFSQAAKVDWKAYAQEKKKRKREKQIQGLLADDE